MDGIVPNGNHHLGHGNNQRPGLHLHPYLIPGENGAQTRRVSVPIGSQLIGTAQLEHVHPPCCRTHHFLVSLLSGCLCQCLDSSFVMITLDIGSRSLCARVCSSSSFATSNVPPCLLFPPVVPGRPCPRPHYPNDCDSTKDHDLDAFLVVPVPKEPRD